jgi:hypothetical protein
MRKPSVYLDTTIPSAFWYEGGDVLALGRRIVTRDWWEVESSHFQLHVSSVTEDELRAGSFRRQKDCLSMVRRLKYLPITRSTRDFAMELLDSRIVPATKPGDALQIAIATTHALDYLLTWNYAHLANPTAQEKLMELCRRRNRAVPLMVSPETIPRVLLGQNVRRKV